MPELPEIETLKHSLSTFIIDSKIIKVIINRNKLRESIDLKIEDKIINSTVTSLLRRGKYLIIKLSNNQVLIIHLGMSGRFLLVAEDYPLTKHDHVVFHLNKNNKLVFNDPRRFGMIYIFPLDNFEQQAIFKNLGVEPLTEEFSPEYLFNRFANKKVPIKTMIMNNNIVVGIGNIYANESLFRAKISPTKLAKDLNFEEILRLVIAIKDILDKAILAGGTSLKDFVNAQNEAGYFKQELAVYGRAGDKCIDCTGKIKNLKQAGRSSFYCEICQLV